MNGIQEYLVQVGLDAMREAAGRLVATSELSAVLVAQSLEELLQELAHARASATLKTPCNLEYKGWQTAKQRPSTGLLIEPIFVQKSVKS